MSQLDLASLIYLFFSITSYFSKVRVDGIEVENPFVRALIGPVIFIVAGFTFVIGGVVVASPLILLVSGQVTWALIAYGVLTLFSAFSVIRVEGEPAGSLLLRVLLVPPLAIVVGLFLLGVGIFLASPVLVVLF